MSQRPVWVFDAFELDLRAWRLSRDGKPLAVEPKVLALLALLIERQGEVVTKNEILDEVWKDASVTENAMVRVVAHLRAVLGDDSKEPKYIETVHTRGYRFAAPARQLVSLTAGTQDAADSAPIPAAAVPEPRPARRRRMLLRVAVALALAGAVIAGWWVRGERPAPITSLAVLPFVNSGGDPDTEYLSDGLSESLITSLSRLPNLQVKSRDSVFRYKGGDAAVQTAARELGVGAILKGRLVQRDGLLSIDVELVDARDNTVIWRNQYSRTVDDILAVEADIAQGVSHNLRLTLTDEEQQLVARRAARSVEAYQLYLRGRHAWERRTEQALTLSVDYFQQAAAADPAYAEAWAALADSYSMLGAWGVLPGTDMYPRARAAAVRALELDDGLARPHATLARVKTEFEWDWEGAEREYQRAIALDPGYGTAHHWYAVHLAAVGRPGEAIAEALRARDTDPLSPAISFDVAWFRYIARQYDDAAAESRRVIAIEPGYAWGHNALGSVYVQTRRFTEALAELRLGLAASRQGALELAYLGHAQAVSGASDEAHRVIEQLQQRPYVPADLVAFVYVGLGDSDRAFGWFEKAYADRSIRAWFLPDPRLDSLRSDPRFMSLMSRMGLPSSK